jgi:DNA ligase-1
MDAPFRVRRSVLYNIKASVPEDSKLVIVEHTKVQGLEEIMKLHNIAVANGYEGLVIRDPDKEYKCGARDNRMLKVKEMQDAEFRIKGIVEGLREEDMCFLMEMPDGTEFRAKPIGDRALKQYYREHLGEIVGKQGVVKFLYYSKGEHPVPTLPVFKCVRLEQDI